MALNFHHPSHSTESKESVYAVEVVLRKGDSYKTRFIGILDINPRVSKFSTKRTEAQLFRLFGRAIGVNAELLDTKDFKTVEVECCGITYQQTKAEIIKYGMKRQFKGFEEQYLLPLDRWKPVKHVDWEFVPEQTDLFREG
jgi:hypothetical protein